VIVAAGLSPAWQQILVFEQFKFGEVNRAREAHWCASGKVLNVGVALQYLGANARSLALVGGNPQWLIEQDLARHGVAFTPVSSSCSTRICTTLIDQATGTSTELIENVARVPPADLELFRLTFQAEARQADFVVLTGSLPAGTPDSYFAELMAGLPARVILDARGPSLQAALAQRPLVVKPNREELQQTLGRPLETEVELRAAMRELNHLGAEWVLVTQGKDRLWLSSATELYSAVPPTVVPVNAIASGDCLAAGLAWALDMGIPMPEAVRFGMAAAADNLRQVLSSRLDREYVQQVAATIDLEWFTKDDRN